MNKAELVDAIVEKATVKKKETDAILSAALDTIVEAVINGDKVSLVGFCSFEKRERAQRQGRNPKTGETMTIAAKSVPAFSMGKLLREKALDAK